MSRHKSVIGRLSYQSKFEGGYKVTVPTPSKGLGQRLEEMLGFCRERFGAQHVEWGAFGSTFYFF